MTDNTEEKGAAKLELGAQTEMDPTLPSNALQPTSKRDAILPRLSLGVGRRAGRTHARKHASIREGAKGR